MTPTAGPRPLRVALATAGSAGDLFPQVAIAEALARAEHAVDHVVPRALGLTLRRLGIAPTTYGATNQADDLRRAAGYGTRWAGWDSWRRLAVEQLAPTLAADTDRCAAHFETLAPDVVATSTFAVAPRLAAHRLGIPLAGLSLYPQLAGPVGTGTHGRAFARAFLDRVASVSGRDDSRPVHALAWGAAPPTALLHDPWLLTHAPAAFRPGPGLPAVGYPAGAGVPARTGDLDAVEAWLAADDRPVVLVTLGSYHRDTAGADRITDALLTRPVRVLAVNAASTRRDRRHLAVGFVPLGTVAPRCTVVVHHGGIGTMFGALASGRPSLVVPRAFDQVLNGRLVQRAGIGTTAPAAEVGDHLDRLLADAGLDARVAAARDALIPAPDAAAAAARHIVAAASH